MIAGNHTGISSGLNEMVARARGTYVGFLDGDDLLAPTALEETVAAFEADPDAGMIYTEVPDVKCGDMRCHASFAVKKVNLYICPASREWPERCKYYPGSDGPGTRPGFRFSPESADACP